MYEKKINIKWSVCLFIFYSKAQGQINSRLNLSQYILTHTQTHRIKRRSKRVIELNVNISEDNSGVLTFKITFP